MKNLKLLFELIFVAIQSAFDRNKYSIVILHPGYPPYFVNGVATFWGYSLATTDKVKEASPFSFFYAVFICRTLITKLVRIEGKFEFKIVRTDQGLHEFTPYDFPLQDFAKHKHTDSEFEHYPIAFLIDVKILEKHPLSSKFSLEGGFLGASIKIELDKLNTFMFTPQFTEKYFSDNCHDAIPGIQEEMGFILRRNGGQFTSLGMFNGKIFLMACVEADKLEHTRSKLIQFFKYLEVTDLISIYDINNLPSKV